MKRFLEISIVSSGVAYIIEECMIKNFRLGISQAGIQGLHTILEGETSFDLGHDSDDKTGPVCEWSLTD